MAPPTNPLAVASRTRVTRSLATQRALRALDGNCHQQQHDRGEAVDSGCSRDVAAAAARPPVLAPPGAPAGQAPLPGEKSTFVSAATQDAVAAACESDHLKHLRLSPGGGVSDDSGEDADSPPFTERESPAVETAAEEDAGVAPHDTTFIDDSLVLRVRCDCSCSDAADDYRCTQLRPSSDAGYDIDAIVPHSHSASFALPDGARRLQIGLHNVHTTDLYTVKLQVGAGPPRELQIQPMTLALTSVLVECTAESLSPRQQSQLDATVVVEASFAAEEPLGLIFEECEDTRDGQRYMVVVEVEAQSQAADIPRLCPGMVLTMIGDAEDIFPVAQIYESFGELPSAMLSARPLRLVFAPPPQGVIEVELLQRPAATEGHADDALPPLTRIRVLP
jgi:hypothetical protein